jgi:aklavinone 12-hydroxylase
VDLFTTWTLLTLNPAWTADLPSLAIPAVQDPTGELADRYGIGDRGASLVRPDGVIAWRTAEPPTDPTAQLAKVLSTVLSR